MRQTLVLGTAALVILSAACGSGRGGPFAYVANNDKSSISVFRVDAQTGMLALVRTVDIAPGGATYCEIHPSGRFMFVSGQFGNDVAAYSIDAAGTPALIAGPMSTGLNPHNIALDPAGRFLYVANTSSDSVSAFAVAANGALAPVAGLPFAAGHTPYDVKVSASGKFAYAVNRDTEDVSVYAVAPANGALTPVPNQPFRISCSRPPCGPRAIEFSPDNRFAFVPNRFSNDVSVLAVNGDTGALTPIAGSPFAAGTDPRSAAVRSDGRYLYVPNVTSNDVSAYSIDATTGSLSPLPGSPYPSGTGPLSLEIDESGQYLYVANSVSNDISVFRTNPGTGQLTPVATIPTAGSAFSIALK